MVGCALALLLLAGGPARAACEDTAAPWDTGGEPTADCDGDGVTPAEGDCDDMDATVRPGVEEVCGDRIDNDCNGLYDDGCDRPEARGSLQGGAGCAGGGVSAAVVLTLPLLWLGRVRRRRR